MLCVRIIKEVDDAELEFLWQQILNSYNMYVSKLVRLAEFVIEKCLANIWLM